MTERDPNDESSSEGEEEESSFQSLAQLAEALSQDNVAPGVLAFDEQVQEELGEAVVSVGHKTLTKLDEVHSPNLLKQFLQSSPQCVELFALLEQSHANVRVRLAVSSAVARLLGTIALHTHRSAGFHHVGVFVARKLIRSHMKVMQSLLEAQDHKHKRNALWLLKAVARYGVTVREFLSRFTFSNKVFSGGVAKNKRSRSMLCDLVLELLHVKDADVLQVVLTDFRRLVTSALSGLEHQSASLQHAEAVLAAFSASVLTRDSLHLSQKMAFFSRDNTVLDALIRVLSCGDSGKAAVADAVLRLVVQAAREAMESPSTRRVGRATLLKLTARLRSCDTPSGDAGDAEEVNARHEKLFVHVLRSQPGLSGVLVQKYMSSASLEPRPSQHYLSDMRLLCRAYSTVSQSATLPPTPASLLPSSLTKLSLTRAMQHQNVYVVYSALVFLNRLLSLCSVDNAACLEEVLPEMQVLVGVRARVCPSVAASAARLNKSKAPLASLLDHDFMLPVHSGDDEVSLAQLDLDRVYTTFLDTLCLLQQRMPAFVKHGRMDPWKLVEGDISTLSCDSQCALLRLLRSFAEVVSGKIWSGAFAQLLRLMCSPGEASQHARKLLEWLLTSTGVFWDGAEVGVWLKYLQLFPDAVPFFERLVAPICRQPYRCLELLSSRVPAEQLEGVPLSPVLFSALSKLSSSSTVVAHVVCGVTCEWMAWADRSSALAGVVRDLLPSHHKRTKTDADAVDAMEDDEQQAVPPTVQLLRLVCDACLTPRKPAGNNGKKTPSSKKRKRAAPTTFHSLEPLVEHLVQHPELLVPWEQRLVALDMNQAEAHVVAAVACAADEEAASQPGDHIPFPCLTLLPDVAIDRVDSAATALLSCQRRPALMRVLRTGQAEHVASVLHSCAEGNERDGVVAWMVDDASVVEELLSNADLLLATAPLLCESHSNAEKLKETLLTRRVIEDGSLDDVTALRLCSTLLPMLTADNRTEVAKRALTRGALAEEGEAVAWLETVVLGPEQQLCDVSLLSLLVDTAACQVPVSLLANCVAAADTEQLRSTLSAVLVGPLIRTCLSHATADHTRLLVDIAPAFPETVCAALLEGEPAEVVSSSLLPVTAAVLSHCQDEEHVTRLRAVLDDMLGDISQWPRVPGTDTWCAELGVVLEHTTLDGGEEAANKKTRPACERLVREVAAGHSNPLKALVRPHQVPVLQALFAGAKHQPQLTTHATATVWCLAMRTLAKHWRKEEEEAEWEKGLLEVLQACVEECKHESLEELCHTLCEGDVKSHPLTNATNSFLSNALRRRVHSPAVLRVVAGVMLVVDEGDEGVMPHKVMLELLLSHTALMRVMLSYTSTEANEEGQAPLAGVQDAAQHMESLSQLLSVLVRGCSEEDECREKLLTLMLASYTATTSGRDKAIFRVLEKYGRVGVQLCKGMTWGREAERRLLSGDEGPADLVWAFANFDRKLLCQGPLAPPALNSDAAAVRYDARFVLPFLESVVVTYGRKLNCLKFLELGAVSYCVLALSAEEELVRRPAYAVLGAYCAALEFADPVSFPAKSQVEVLLLCVKNAVHTPFQRLPSVSTAFVDNALAVVLRPEHVMYIPVCKFTLKRPELALNELPMFYSLFFSSDADGNACRTQVQWVLRVLLHGLVSSLDVFLVMKSFVFPLILSLYCSPLADKRTRSMVAQVLSRAALIPKGATVLVEEHGLLAWLACNAAPSRPELLSTCRTLLSVCASRNCSSVAEFQCGVLKQALSRCENNTTMTSATPTTVPATTDENES